jgi:polysaccharide export outer membrane protein
MRSMMRFEVREAGSRMASACLLVLLVAVAACSSTSGSPTSTSSNVLALQSSTEGAGALRMVPELPAPTNTRDGLDQPLAANDVLQIDVFQADTLDRTVQIDSTGRISLPLVGTVTAAGKTVRQLEAELEQAYGARYLQSPDITVFLKESFGQRVTIDGEVAKAGIYPVSSNSTLIDAVALAGGFRPVADQSKIYVYRDVGNQKLVANYDVAQIRNGKKPNPRIYGGDVIVVFTSQSKVALQNLKEALGLASNASRLAVIP